MMNILDKIIVHKKTEIAHNQKISSIKDLEKSKFFERKTISLKEKLQTKAGIIAEFKLKSPSKGIIHHSNQSGQELANQIPTNYAQAGAAAVSVLTDVEFFGGKDEYLQIARENVNIPLLRKDFIIDEYQIVEAKAIGADLILLISACLDGRRLKELAKFAHSLGLEVLIEVHNELELEDTINEYVDLVGVNNRNLKTFEVSIQTSLDLADKIPTEFVKVSESGLSDIQTIQNLQKAGFQGFLIGETFMKTENPAESLQKLLLELSF